MVWLAVQVLNALLRTVVTLAGMVMLVRLVQLLNAIEPIDVTPEPMVTLVRPVQP